MSSNKLKQTRFKLRNHQDSYLLFVNWFGCCMGIDSTYEIHVGRSSSRTGPYLDKDGVEMTNGGGRLEYFYSLISLISHTLQHIHVPKRPCYNWTWFDCDTKHFIIKSLTLSGGYWRSCHNSCLLFSYEMAITKIVRGITGQWSS